MIAQSKEVQDWGLDL